jgi:hypothetical protein
MLSALFVHGASGSLFGFFLGNAAILVRFLDMLVLTVAFATFFDTSWHFVTLLSW